MFPREFTQVSYERNLQWPSAFLEFEAKEGI